MDLWTDKTNMSICKFSGPIIEPADTAILRLSAALRQHEDEWELKYVIVIQCRNTLGLYKLVVSNSKKAAGMDMFYEVLNGNSVCFVGAVLKDVPIPAEYPHKFPQTKFKGVESMRQLRRVEEEEDVNGIIC